MSLTPLYTSLVFIFFISQCYSRELIGESGGCKLTLPNDVPENEPVYLIENKGKFEFYEPKGKDNFIRPNENLILFCPGSRNQIKLNSNQRGQLGQNITEITCNRNNNFTLDNDVVKINRLNCTKEVTGDLKTTNKKCANNLGTISEIGFKLDSRRFIKQIETCFNNRTSSAIYSKYKINGKAIKYNVKESERRSFSATGFPRGLSPNDLYKKANQIKHLKNLLGNGQNFINETSYLSRGHLAADADFIFSSGQFATYFYANVAPQFQIINGGNWLRVEKIARSLATNYETDLTIFSGIFGQLRLPGESGQQLPLFLNDNDKIAVPLWFYKIILDEQARSAIVFVTSNNPFIHRNAIRPFCNDVCERAGLSMKEFKDTRKGFTFCCEYDEFLTDNDIFPRNTFSVSKLLSCANIEIPE